MNHFLPTEDTRAKVSSPTRSILFNEDGDPCIASVFVTADNVVIQPWAEYINLWMPRCPAISITNGNLETHQTFLEVLAYAPQRCAFFIVTNSAPTSTGIAPEYAGGISLQFAQGSPLRGTLEAFDRWLSFSHHRHKSEPAYSVWFEQVHNQLAVMIANLADPAAIAVQEEPR